MGIRAHAWRPLAASLSISVGLVGCAPTRPQGSDVPIARTSTSPFDEAAQARTQAWARVRASLAPEDVVYYFRGAVYAQVPKAMPLRFSMESPLLHLEGYNIARRVSIDGRAQILTREAVFYTDPKTDKIVDCWTNPLNGKTVRVVHVFNDPVNFSGEGPVDQVDLGENVVLGADVLLAYPSPLPVANYADYSGNDVYQGAELFSFVVRRADLEDGRLASVPATVSWTRVGPFLPWMQMGAAPGVLIYRSVGRKLAHGYADLPEHVRTAIEERAPLYRTAPSAPSQPNMTSWRYFKSLVDRNAYSPSCGAS